MRTHQGFDVGAFLADYARSQHPVILAAVRATQEWRRLPLWRRLQLAGIGRSRKARRSAWVEARADEMLVASGYMEPSA